MSKLITISIAMDLIEDRLLSLDDPVINYIPEFKNLKVAVNSDGTSLAMSKSKDDLCPFNLVEPDSVLKIKHLFDHTAGFYYALNGISCIDSLAATIDVPNQENGNQLINSLSKLQTTHNKYVIYCPEQELRYYFSCL